MRAEQVLEKTYDEIAYSPHFRMVLARAVGGLTPTEKHVLSFIAEAANAEHGGASWYAQASISAELGCSREAVNRAFHELLARNLVSRHGGDMRTYRVSEKLPPSKSCKVFLNLQELIKQTDPVTAYDITQERKAQKAAALKRKAARATRVDYGQPGQQETAPQVIPGQEPQQPAQVWEEIAQVVEPAGDLTDLEDNEPGQPPMLALTAPSKPVEPVALAGSGRQVEGQTHPWLESSDPEEERARQLAALARYEESA